MLKSSERAAPGGRRSTPCAARPPRHRFTEYDLRGDRADAQSACWPAARAGRRCSGGDGPAGRAGRARERCPTLPLVFCMVQDPAELGLQPAPPTRRPASPSRSPCKNQLAAFRMVNPRARAHRRRLQRRERAASWWRRRRRRPRSCAWLLVAAAGGQSSARSPQALRALLTGAEAVDALWIPPDPVLLGDETRRFMLAETLKAGRPSTASPPPWWRRARWSATGPTWPRSASWPRAGEPARPPASASIEMLVPRAELVINKKHGRAAEDRDPGRGAEGRSNRVL